MLMKWGFKFQLLTSNFQPNEFYLSIWKQMNGSVTPYFTKIQQKTQKNFIPIVVFNYSFTLDRPYHIVL